MALSLTTAIKDQVATYLFSSTTYAALGSGYQQNLIDKWGASVLLELEEWSKWFAFSTGAGAAPDSWEGWFVDAIIARIQGNTHPDRAPAARAQALKSMRNAIDSYTRNTITYDPSSTTEAFVFHCQNNRKYVLSHCIRLERPLYPDMATVDAAFAETAAYVFNRTGWTFRRRPVTVAITRTAFTGGTWTESTKTISGLTSVGTGLAAGTRFYVTGGTGANTPSDHSIASTTSTTIVLNSSLGSAANTQTDIAGFYVTVDFEGLEASETFDSIASGRFMYLDAGFEGDSLIWLAADDFVKMKAINGEYTGRPCYFRTYQVGSSVTAWGMIPPPDTNYRLRGEVYIAQPASPSSATSTTSFAKYASEFQAAMRRMQLDRVLTNYGRHDQALHAQVESEMEALFPIYQSAGEPASRVGVPDVYGDYTIQNWNYPNIGGQGI